MSDEVSRILMESKINSPTTEKKAEVKVSGKEFSEEEFDEQGYLRRYQDVAKNVAKGEFRSGYEHYKKFGRFEDRLASAICDTSSYDKLVIIPGNDPSTSQGSLERVSIDGLLVCPSGGIMLIGWIDDLEDPIDYIVIESTQWQVRISAQVLVRIRREDVEALLSNGLSYSYGLFCLHFEELPIPVTGQCGITLLTVKGRSATFRVQPQIQNASGLRNVVLSYLAAAKFFSNYQLEAISNVSRGLGRNVLGLNRYITREIVANPYVERFGAARQRLRGSIIVCLYGRAEYLFLQSALFSDRAGMEDYEFVYVSNSPELAETLLREAGLASKIYDQRITIVLLSGNAGFGAANNAAVSAAQSDRILIVNPDVFPRDPEWALKHTLLLQDRPAEQTKMFGVPLYYDDGSLMHGGMYFDLDSGVLLQDGSYNTLNLVRVEHYGKGAPSWVSHLTELRPVPAVTGAFISLDRAWYEKLGGFTEDYVFGHYEDADLCLKSFLCGNPPWMHDLRLWHLEGKGSTRLPVHEGGSLINRWFFSEQWSELINRCLLGPEVNLDVAQTMVNTKVSGITQAAKTNVGVGTTSEELIKNSRSPESERRRDLTTLRSAKRSAAAPTQTRNTRPTKSAAQISEKL